MLDRIKEKFDSFENRTILYVNIIFLISNFSSLILKKNDFVSLESSIAVYLPLILAGFILSVFFRNIDKKNKIVIHLILVLLLFNFLSYLVWMTNNINNPNYILFLDFKDQFLQSKVSSQLFILFLTLILFVMIWRRTQWLTFLGPSVTHIKYSHTILFTLLMNILTMLFINDKKLDILIDSSNYLQMLKENSFTMYLVNIFYLVLVLFIFSGLIAKGYCDLVRRAPSSYSVISVSFILSIFLNFGIQYSIVDPANFYPSIYYHLLGSIFQIISSTILFALIYFLLNRFIVSSIVNVMIGVIFIVANGMKFRLRHEPILPSDLVWLRQLRLLLGFVDSKVSYAIVVAIIFVALSYYIIYKRISDFYVFSNKKFRLLSIISVLSIMFSLLSLMRVEDGIKHTKNIPIITPLTNEVNVNWLGNTVNANVKSLSFVWYKQIVSPPMELPFEYSRNKISEIKEKYSQIATDINKTRKNNIADQTVIFILSESFSDPNKIPGTSISMDILPNIREIKNHFTSGTMISDGYGGGTANMEFQSLTGLPMYNMSSSISTIYTDVVPKMRFIPTLSDYFSPANRIAIHLESGNNYARNGIYKKMGYETYIGTSDSDVIVKDFKREGLYPSDASTYQLVLDRLTGTPQFFSLITMQNHMPWSAGLPKEVTAVNELFSQEENESLTSYSRLLSMTDKSTKEFLDDLDKKDEKISVVFYGDHLPSLYHEEHFQERPELQYQTEYFIWSNFKTEKKNRPILYSSDFIAALLETTDSKVSPYSALLTKVMENSTVSEEDLSEEGREILNDFKIVEYDLLRNKGFLEKDDDFFKIGD